MKKILGITGIRSDYDLMSSLYRKLKDDPELDFRLLVGGAHLSPSFGYTRSQIERDGMPVLLAVESLIDADTTAARLKTGSIMLQNTIDIVAGWQPDLLLFAGDREEVWIGALLATYLEIPSVHFYGGDHTLTGHVDNPVRHAVSKLASAHFVTTLQHKERLIALGEHPRRIFVIGSPALDNFAEAPCLSDQQLAEELGLKGPVSPHAMVIFHPDPQEKNAAARMMQCILASLLEKGFFVFVGYPNTDPANRGILQVIESYRENPRVYCYKNLARAVFLSLYKTAALIIGNSSSGIMESATAAIPAVNVGLRQRGRLAPDNVVFCDGNKAAILQALDKVASSTFRQQLANLVNPYGDGRSTDRAVRLLKEIDFSGMRLKTEDPLDVISQCELPENRL